MPRASHEQTVHRQWTILRRLTTRRPGLTAREICEYLADEGMPVSKRTVERDLNDLSRLFPLVSTEGGPPIGWRWQEGASANLPGMDLMEALSLSLVGDLLAKMLPPSLHRAIQGRVDEANRKLDALPDKSVAGWSQLARYLPPGLPLLPPTVSTEVMQAVEEALLAQRRLKVAYRSARAGKVSEFELHPLALLSHGPSPYLLATIGPGSQIWQYALHRVERADVCKESAWRPDRFSLDRFLAEGEAQFGAGPLVKLVARVSSDLAGILRETPLSHDQRIGERNGVHTVRATVRQSWQLEFFILSQGERMTVTRPKALREKTVSTLRSALSNYETS